ncbi:c-type cytochrome [Paracoccus onubensis]|uniref:c-type cytochrome n=1 Tax=Paracoccus onubensis TaxID=1675788 RepID=UPI0027314C6C|nr:c-type cytochrome [Paracoccus onubensis]MDP0926844.1 c-type cytochrome [Paracoccus onubensis]
MKRVLLILLALALLGVVTAVSVVGLGLYNVSARSGHLPGVSWALHTTFRNSVRLRASAPDDMPDLSDPELIALGAGHYATACAPCHAEPGKRPTATMRAMQPQPPAIREAVTDWNPAELHWIIDNGVKMSGMPGWPTGGRGDEVWAVVAYLETVRRNASPPLPTPKRDRNADAAEAGYCRTCHGSISRHVPRLDIQQPEYLTKALQDYLKGERPSGIMQQAVSRVPPEAIPGLARYFATVPLSGAKTTGAPVAGKELASRGTRKVPACIACHGPGAPLAQPPAPALAGQDRAFLETQLRLWRDGIRQGSARMSAAARALTDHDIRLLSEWYASLEAGSGNAE